MIGLLGSIEGGARTDLPWTESLWRMSERWHEVNVDGVFQHAALQMSSIRTPVKKACDAENALTLWAGMLRSISLSEGLCQFTLANLIAETIHLVIVSLEAA